MNFERREASAALAEIGRVRREVRKASRAVAYWYVAEAAATLAFFIIVSTSVLSVDDGVWIMVALAVAELVFGAVRRVRIDDDADECRRLSGMFVIVLVTAYVLADTLPASQIGWAAACGVLPAAIAADLAWRRLH